jgi:hypothetical protein
MKQAKKFDLNGMQIIGPVRYEEVQSGDRVNTGNEGSTLASDMDVRVYWRCDCLADRCLAIGRSPVLSNAYRDIHSQFSDGIGQRASSSMAEEKQDLNGKR